MNRHLPQRLRGWTESRCDSVCPPSGHFVARPALTSYALPSHIVTREPIRQRKPTTSLFQNSGANHRPERPPHDSPGQRPGSCAIIAIKRCKRATIPVLTPVRPDVVAQISKSAVAQASKPADRGHAWVLASVPPCADIPPEFVVHPANLSLTPGFNPGLRPPLPGEHTRPACGFPRPRGKPRTRETGPGGFQASARKVAARVVHPATTGASCVPQLRNSGSTACYRGTGVSPVGFISPARCDPS